MVKAVGASVLAVFLAGCSSAGTVQPLRSSSGAGGYFDAVEAGTDAGVVRGAAGNGPEAGPDAVTDATTGSEAGDAGQCNGTEARFVTGVLGYHFGPGQNQGQNAFPQIIFGPPKGGGATQGSLDTVSLGNGGWVSVEFQGNLIVDEPGPDFIVFENPFYIDGNPDDVYAELGTVAVSSDGVNWVTFPCTATAPPYGECAGWHPVYANPDTNNIDPLDPTVAGGDAFDLADVGVSSARYVRITDRADLPTVFDLDAVGIVHALCP